MNIKKTKIAFVLSTVVFLSMPFANAVSHEKHCEIEDTQLGDTMKYMKSELRAYVKGFKKDDTEKMQTHITELIKLSAMAADQTPVKIENMHVEGGEGHGDMAIPAMDHSKMDHSKMDHGDMNSADHDMSSMPSMEGMSAEQHHQHMMYMQGISQLKNLFKQLQKTQDKTEIKAILGQIKEHSKKSHQLFRQDCN